MELLCTITYSRQPDGSGFFGAKVIGQQLFKFLQATLVNVRPTINWRS